MNDMQFNAVDIIAGVLIIAGTLNGLRRGLAADAVPLSQSSYMVSNDGGYFATNGYGTAYIAHQQNANFGFPDGHVEGLTMAQFRTKDINTTTKWNALPYATPSR